MQNHHKVTSHSSQPTQPPGLSHTCGENRCSLKTANGYIKMLLRCAEICVQNLEKCKKFVFERWCRVFCGKVQKSVSRPQQYQETTYSINFFAGTEMIPKRSSSDVDMMESMVLLC
jgi:hypothetical protein